MPQPPRFNFPFHQPSDEYPDSSLSIRLGRGYEFASAPKGPDQMTYNLKFQAMFFFVDTLGTVNLDPQPQLNARALQLFYESVRMYTPFVYPHPIRGNQLCRFSKPFPPLTMAKGLKIYDDVTGLYGHQVEAFTITIRAMP